MEFGWKPLEFIELSMSQDGRKKQAVMMAYIAKYRAQQKKELDELKRGNKRSSEE